MRPRAGRAPASPLVLPVALFGALVLALAGLLVGFVVTSRAVDRQFDLARLSEQQSAAVTRIAVLIGGGAAPPPLHDALDRFAGLIRVEQQLSAGGGPEAARVADELAQVARLRALALDPRQREAVGRLAAAIDRREAQEVAAARRRLDALHRRAAVLAALLAGVVLACAGAGGWLLARRNRLLHDEVRARTAQLEAVDASRRLFVAKISHELRTPVQAMRSQAEIALAAPGADPARLRETLDHVVAGAVGLGHRIDELLGLASADRGQLQLRPEPADLRAVVAAAVDECQVVARAVECPIALALPGQPCPVRADSRWLRQALVAVIDNGLKVSPMGEPLRVVLNGTGDAATLVVTDRGPGVVAAELPRIFDAFYQAEAGRTRGGNGLGLALARWVVEQHGGTIAAATLPQGGCAVTITLPRSSAA